MQQSSQAALLLILLIIKVLFFSFQALVTNWAVTVTDDFVCSACPLISSRTISVTSSFNSPNRFRSTWLVISVQHCCKLTLGGSFLIRSPTKTPTFTESNSFHSCRNLDASCLLWTIQATPLSSPWLMIAAAAGLFNKTKIWATTTRSSLSVDWLSSKS